jgi:hypothetical protein
VPSQGVAALVALLAALLVACGGEEGEPRQFASLADGICADAAREEVSAFRDSLRPGDDEVGSQYLELLTEIRAREFGRLEDLEAPAGGEADPFLEQRQAAQEALEEARERLGGEDQVALDSARARAQQLAADAEELAQEAGLVACARRLSADERRRVARTLRLTATSGDAERLCTELATGTFVEQFGGEAACIRGQSQSRPADAVEIESLRGVDGVSADARIELDRPGAELSHFDVRLVWEEEGPKVESIVVATPPR